MLCKYLINKMEMYFRHPKEITEPRAGNMLARGHLSRFLLVLRVELSAPHGAGPRACVFSK